MRAFLEIAVWLHTADACVDKMSARGVFAGKRHDIIVCTGAQRACAESKTVVGIGHSVEKCADVGVARYDARQPENRHGWIVGVHAHIDAVFVAYGHDGVEEVSHVGAQLLGCYAFVEVEQGAEFLHGLKVVFGNVAVDESLGLDDNVFHQTMLSLGCHRGFICSTRSSTSGE